MHNLPLYAPILRRSALVLVSALAFSLASLPRVGYCSDTNTIEFVYREDFEIYRSQVTNECAHILADCASIDDDLTEAMEDAGHAWSSIQDAMTWLPEDGNSAFREMCYGHMEDAVSYVLQCQDDIYAAKEQIWQIERSARNINSFMVSFHTFNDDGGCNCPDYTSLLETLIARVQNINLNVTSIKSDVGNIAVYVQDLYWTVPNFILGFEQGAVGSTDWSDLTNSGIEGGNLFGRVVSNFWASASPQTLQSRIMRYTEYVSEEIEPTPNGVASDVPLVAIIGLLYRIQHQQMITNRTLDVYSSRAEEEMDEAKEEAEEAEDQQQQEMDDVDTDLDIDVSADSGILKLWDELQKFLNALEGVLRSSSQSQELIVLAADGISINLGRSGSAVSRPGRVSVSAPSSGNWSTFCSVVRSICTILWYVLGAIIVYFLTVKVFTIVSTGVTLAIAIAGGDISGAVTLAERFFHKST